MSRKPVIKVWFFGGKDLLVNLIANEILKPIRRGRHVVFSLGDVSLLAERISELEATLRKIAKGANAELGREKSNAP